MDYSQWRADLDAARGDADELYRLGTELLGVARFLSAPVPSRKASRHEGKARIVSGNEDDGVSRATWLTPVQVAWDKEMGDGTFPFGPAAKALAPLYKKGHSPDEIGKRIGYYLRSLARRNELKFYSLPKFASTFNQWNPDEPAFDED